MDEVRIGNDHCAYTFALFQAYYGGTAKRRWGRARRVNAAHDMANTTPASASQPASVTTGTSPERSEGARLTEMLAVEKRKCLRLGLEQLVLQALEPQFAVGASAVLAVPSASPAKPTWRYCHERAVYFSLSGEGDRVLLPRGAAWEEEL